MEMSLSYIPGSSQLGSPMGQGWCVASTEFSTAKGHGTVLPCGITYSSVGTVKSITCGSRCHPLPETQAPLFGSLLSHLSVCSWNPSTMLVLPVTMPQATITSTESCAPFSLKSNFGHTQPCPGKPTVFQGSYQFWTSELLSETGGGCLSVTTPRSSSFWTSALRWQW